MEVQPCSETREGTCPKRGSRDQLLEESFLNMFLRAEDGKRSGREFMKHIFGVRPSRYLPFGAFMPRSPCALLRSTFWCMYHSVAMQRSHNDATYISRFSVRANRLLFLQRVRQQCQERERVRSMLVKPLRT